VRLPQDNEQGIEKNGIEKCNDNNECLFELCGAQKLVKGGSLTLL
jgi:hypothetical protein